VSRPDIDPQVRALMSDPATHGGAEPAGIETHAARVYLAGAHAYKLKKPVDFGYLDFSTPQKRLAALQAELDLNCPGAPQLYQDLIWITREKDGSLALGGRGEPVEPVLKMARFPDGALLSDIAGRGAFGVPLAVDLAHAVRASHERAPVHKAPGAADRLRRVLRDVCGTLAAAAPDAAGRVRRLETRLADALEARAGLLDERGEAGFVRRCHGDLHLGNIVLLESGPVLFDALEFNEDLAVTDTAYDLAFLVMDMAARGLAAPLTVLLSHYFSHGEAQGAAGAGLLAPLSALRALVRAMTALQRGHEGDRQAALERLTLAEAFAGAPPPRLAAVGGLSGTGKSTLAQALAAHFGGPSGALVLRADLERKALAGAAWNERLPESAYTQEASARVYERLRAKAEAALNAGGCVILDAVHAREEERDAAEAVAEHAGAPFLGLWLEAGADILKARVGARKHDASDADARVVERQAQYDCGVVRWTRIDASGGPQASLGAALRALASAPD